MIADVVELFGSNFSLTMEEYFTELESIHRLSRLFDHSGNTFTPAKIKEKRDRLMKALAAVLEEATDVSRRDQATCEYHRLIVDHLEPTDTIISFNYDCVIDHALRRHADGKWSARYGYTFPRPTRIEGHENWSAASSPTSATGSIYLLKLHGSLHWQLPSPDSDDPSRAAIRLKERLYQLRGTPRFTIIPPEWVKNIEDDPNFLALWRNAERAIRNAKSIAFVGFSFAPTDLHVESLFRVALAANRVLTQLVIANPLRADRRRVRHVFAKALLKPSIVRQYDTIEDFAKQLGNGAW